MTGPVIALGLDATAPALLEQWMDAGKLPVLARLRARGGYGYVNNVDYYRTETSWITFLTGALPQQTGEWGHMDYEPRAYVSAERSAYSFDRYPPFYAGLDRHRVAIFDPPLAQPVDGVDGIQIMGWGTEVNQCLRVSRPPALLRELSARHGDHPLYEPSLPTDRADGEVVSYSIPSTYTMASLLQLANRLQLGVERRSAIISDLLGREPWDLLMAVFAETHTSSHLLWHLSQPHPLNAQFRPPHDPMLQVFQAVDAAIGEIIDILPADARLILFSIYGIGPNVLDLPSMAFLPELLYRWNYPGQTALDVKTGTAQAATPSPGYPRHWREEMWDHRSANGDRLLQSPYAQEANADPLHWQPCNWYRPLWPGMRAFALPTYSEGLIRLNVAGRDGHGIVQPDNYREVCDELCDFLQQTRTAGSGLPMVRDIIRTRKTAFDQPTSAPPADLIVLWQEETPTQAIAHPRVGDIGPWPYFRTGGHCSRGFWMASGPGFEPGSRLPDLHACELTALFRQLLADGDTRRR